MTNSDPDDDAKEAEAKQEEENLPGVESNAEVKKEQKHPEGVESNAEAKKEEENPPGVESDAEAKQEQNRGFPTTCQPRRHGGLARRAYLWFSRAAGNRGAAAIMNR